MINDIGRLIDDLLIRWWQWRSPIQPTRGHGRTAAGFESWRCSRQYDDANGALDADMDDAQMRLVDASINLLDSTHRVALYVQARGLVYGHSVIGSPRLPASGPERAALLAQARQALARRLEERGLL